MKLAKKTRLSISAVLLALLLAIMAPIQILAQADSTDDPDYETEIAQEAVSRYLLGLMLCNNADADTAKATLVAAGYSVIDQNLRQGNSGECVYLGYTTTTDINEAITDISMMNMNGGFEVMNYYQIAEVNKANINAAAEQFKTACAAFAKNAAAKGQKALNAKKMLDLLTVSSKDSRKLGDYLLSSSRTTEDFSEILVKASAVIVTYIYSQLLVGTSDIGESWMKRLSDSGEKQYTEEELQSLEQLYGEKAEALEQVVTAYVSNCISALERFTENNNTINAPDIEDEADLTMYLADCTCGSADTDTEDALYLATYAVLSKYPYGDGTLAE